MNSDYYMYGILALFTALVATSFYRLQKDKSNDFNLFDLLMEGGRVSRIAVAFMVTLIVTSWIMLKLSIDQKMTEGYLVSYGAMWVAPIIARMFATNSVSYSQASTTTTTTQEVVKPTKGGKK